jgi:Susd and RagB outer membrane lipoprotein
VRKSIARVLAFPAEAGVTVPANRIPAQSEIDTYVSKVLAQYDAGTDDQKLNVVMKEWYLALWGNGVDAYNNYRRTGKPDNMQLALSSNPGLFARSMFYPAVSADLNQNVSQKPDVFQKVFWDNNPDNFLK